MHFCNNKIFNYNNVILHICTQFRSNHKLIYAFFSAPINHRKSMPFISLWNSSRGIYIYEGADRVRGRWEVRGREEGEEGEGGGRRRGGRREERGREEGEEGAGGGRGEKKREGGGRGKFCARAHKKGGGRQGGGRGEVWGREGGGEAYPPVHPLIYEPTLILNTAALCVKKVYFIAKT